MSAALNSTTNVTLREAPINPLWIHEGKPVVRNRLLWRSRDATACTIVSDCTAGTFDWHYETNETVHILEGSVVIAEGQAPPRRLDAGDVAFFPAGSSVRWTVDAYVRKVAFCRRAPPRPVERVVKRLRAVTNLFRAPVPTGLMNAGRA